MTKEKFPWLDRVEYPFLSRYMELNGQQLHYVDEGEGETLLFVHGTPSWSFDFRHLIIALRKSYRCIAFDHIGFGLSDKPENYDYSIQHHSNTLQQFIRKMDLSNITLVLHDFGGPIGFHFALDYPGKVKSMVVMNSWLWDFSDSPAFKKFSSIINSPVTSFLYKKMNFSAKYLLPKSFGRKKLPRRLLQNYTKPFASSSQRNGTLAFARSLVNDQQWFEGLWEKRAILRHLPILFIWGMMDKFVRPGFMDKFVKGFPNSSFKALEHCGHFPQEEDPDKVIESMQAFLKGV